MIVLCNLSMALLGPWTLEKQHCFWFLYFIKDVATTRTAFCLIVYIYSVYVQNLQGGNETAINAKSRITIAKITCCFLGKGCIYHFVSCNSIFIFNKMPPLGIERASRASTHMFLRRNGQLQASRVFFFPGACCQCTFSVSCLKR